MLKDFLHLKLGANNPSSLLGYKLTIKKLYFMHSPLF
jgi:hypothetical protein